MSLNLRRAGWLFASFCVLACGREGGTTRTKDDQAALGGEIAARVGGSALPLSVVLDVARAQNVTLSDAVRAVVDDEIAASAARARGLDRSGAAAWRLVSTRARWTSDRLFAEAKGQGLPTDDEVKAVTERHWAEVDRPETVRVVHALVLRPKNAELVGDARALAQQMQRKLTDVGTDDFESTATAFEHDAKLQTLAEKLPPFTEAGLVPGGGAMDAGFAKGAFALRAPGETSGVVESAFGFHIIRLLERIPEQRMALETRRLAFAEEVYVMRAHALMTAILDRQRAENPVVVSPAAERLMSTVKLAPDGPPSP